MKTEYLGKVHKGLPLAGYTTLKIGGAGEYVFFPSTIEELISVREFLKANNKKITIIGAGSNLLISSQGIEGGVIFTSNLKDYRVFEDGAIQVASGVRSTNIAKLLYNESLTGLEFLIGIPGSLGGAVTMNSSAHGQSIKDVIISSEVLDIETGEVITMGKDELELNYRSSFVQKSRHIILSSTF